jgi:hypothetical protein
MVFYCLCIDWMLFVCLLHLWRRHVQPNEQPVSGVLLLAKNSPTARTLALQFRQKGPERVSKTYHALVGGSLQPHPLVEQVAGTSEGEVVYRAHMQLHDYGSVLCSRLSRWSPPLLTVIRQGQQKCTVD